MTDSLEEAVRMMRNQLELTQLIANVVRCDREEIPELEELQQRQADLRERIGDRLGQYLPVSSELKHLTQQCLAIEQDINQALIARKQQVREELSKLQDGELARNKYGNVYSQFEGYFIDKKK